MSRFFTFCTLIAVTLLTTACPPVGPVDPDDTDAFTVTGKIEDMPSDRDYTLKVICYNEDDDDEGMEIASAPIAADGSFSVKLPDRIDSRYMALYNKSEWAYGLPHDGVTVSNGDVKFSISMMEVFVGNKYVGDVYYETEEETEDEYEYSYSGTSEILLYSDGDCDITGSYFVSATNGDAVYDISVGKGWNRIYVTEESRGNNATSEHEYEFKVVSEAPAGLEFHFSNHENRERQRIPRRSSSAE